MKKKEIEQLVTDTEVLFEMNSNGFHTDPDDPTTSLATSTMTHIFTLINFPASKQK